MKRIKGRNGVSKNSFSQQLQILNDKIRLSEQRLAMKVDREISEQYFKKENEIKQLKTMLSTVKKKQQRNQILFTPFIMEPKET